LLFEITLSNASTFLVLKIIKPIPGGTAPTTPAEAKFLWSLSLISLSKIRQLLPDILRPGRSKTKIPPVLFIA